MEVFKDRVAVVAGDVFYDSTMLTSSGGRIQRQALCRNYRQRCLVGFQYDCRCQEQCALASSLQPQHSPTFRIDFGFRNCTDICHGWIVSMLTRDGKLRRGMPLSIVYRLV